MASLKAWDGGSHLMWSEGGVVCWGLLVMQIVMRVFCLGSCDGYLIHVVSLGVVLVCKVVIVMGDGRLARVTGVVVPSMRLCVWETLHHLLLAETRRVGDGYLIKQQRIIRKKVKFGGPEINSTTPA